MIYTANQTKYVDRDITCCYIILRKNLSERCCEFKENESINKEMGFHACMLKIILTLIFSLLCENAFGWTGNVYNHSMSVDGLQRFYKVYVPLSANDNADIVYILHGIGGTASGAFNKFGFPDWSDNKNIVSIYPQGTDNDQERGGTQGAWNAGSCCTVGYPDVNDVGFLEAVLTKVRADYNLLTGKAFIFGYSNGGMMSYRMACQSTAISGAAIAAGSLMIPYDNCRPMVPIYHFHRLEDPTVKFYGGYKTKGGYQIYYYPVPQIITFWAQYQSVSLYTQHGGHDWSYWAAVPIYDMMWAFWNE